MNANFQRAPGEFNVSRAYTHKCAICGLHLKLQIAPYPMVLMDGDDEPAAVHSGCITPHTYYRHRKPVTEPNKSENAVPAAPAVVSRRNVSSRVLRSEEHTSELQSHSFTSYAVFFL